MPGSKLKKVVTPIKEKVLDWSYMARTVKLSDKFIRRNIDKLNWRDICIGQKLRVKFIETNIDDINWVALSTNNNTPKKVLWKFRDKINWSRATKYIKFSFLQKKRFKDYIIPELLQYNIYNAAKEL